MRDIIENWQGSDEDLLIELNTKSITVTDSTFYTSRHLMTRITPDEFRLVYGTLKQAATVDPLAESAKTLLDSAGLDFSNPLTQGTIDALAAAGSWPAELAEKVKEIGIKQLSPAEQSLGRDATQDDVDSVRSQIAVSQVTAKANAAIGAASLAFEAGNSADDILVAAENAWSGN